MKRFKVTEKNSIMLPGSGVVLVNANVHPVSLCLDISDPDTITQLDPAKVVLDDGTEIVLGWVLAASMEEVDVGIHIPGVQLVTTRPEPMESGQAVLDRFCLEYPRSILCSSIISAQAYVYPVVSLIPVPGFERVPPAEKRMRVDKFNTYTS